MLGTFFIITKAFNHRLHYMFDTSEMIEETASSDEGSDDAFEKSDDANKAQSDQNKQRGPG